MKDALRNVRTGKKNTRKEMMGKSDLLTEFAPEETEPKTLLIPVPSVPEQAMTLDTAQAAPSPRLTKIRQLL